MNTTINDITLYDLMAEDFTVWLGKNKTFGYILHLEGETKKSPQMKEEKIHPYAIDSFATFCRSFLHDYDKLQKEEAA